MISDVRTLTSSLANQEQAVAALPHELRATVAEVRATIGDLQDILNGMRPELDASVQNIRSSTDNLARLTGRMDGLLLEHEDDVAAFMQDGLGEVPGVMRDARDTLRELEKLLHELRDDPSQLIHRPADYEEE